jgi:phospholipid/cholesterol/gamma-HCH transport system ATP-binding protein
MIDVRDLHKGFGTQRVLRGVNLRIERGEAVVIIGRSGCGKSVLLKHLIGLVPPDAGEVRVDGQALAGLDERALIGVRRRFGMLFQMAALFDSLDVYENVSFVLRREGRHSEAEMRAMVAEALHRVELLARAIVYRPSILLYDEPTTGLDPIASDRIDRLIRKVWEELGVTSIAVTHDMRSARRISNRVVMLHEGRVHADGATERILSSDDPLVYNFVNGIATETAELP